MAGRIPQQFLQTLLRRVDLAEVVQRHVPLQRAGGEYKACCPFHNEKTPSFTVSPAKGFYHCFGCGAHGTAISFLMEYAKYSFIDAVEELAAGQGLEVPRAGGGGAPATFLEESFVVRRSLLHSCTSRWRAKRKRTNVYQCCRFCFHAKLPDGKKLPCFVL